MWDSQIHWWLLDPRGLQHTSVTHRSVLGPGGLTAVLGKGERTQEGKKKLKLLLRSGKNDLRIISAASRDGFYVTFIFVFVHRMRDELAALSKNASLCVSRQQL